MRPIAWILIALLALPVAAAQPGPAPGYGSAAGYAVDHAGGEAEDAATDPVGYAGGLAGPGAVRDEAEHALYIACWAADDQGVQHEACDPYYTPRGRAAPEQPAVAPDPAAETDPVNDTLAGAGGLADEVVGAVEDTVADPGSAPTQVERIADAAVGFLAGVAGTVGDAVDGLADAVARLAGIGPAVGGAGAQAVDAVGDGIARATEALGAVGRGVAHAATSAGSGIADAGRATVDGVGRGASGAGRALADAGRAVGSAVSDAADAVRDAVGGLLGGEAEQQGRDGPAVPDVEGIEDVGIDTVTGLLP